MRKLIESRITVANKAATKIQERISNTGIRDLEKNSGKITKELLAVLTKYNLIDVEDDTVTILVEVKN